MLPRVRNFTLLLLRMKSLLQTYPNDSVEIPTRERLHQLTQRIDERRAKEKDRPRLLDVAPSGLVEDPLPFHRAFLLHLDTDAILSFTSVVRSSTLFRWPSWATLYETR